MGWFSSSDEKSTLATHPVNPDVTTKYGSGAEQDRYGARFGIDPEKVGSKVADTYEKTKDAATSGYVQAKEAAEKGYDQAKQAAERKYGQAKDAAEKGYGQAKDAAERGYDHAKDATERGYARGKEALDKAINAKGVGAEQDTYGNHFDYTSLDLKPVTKAALSIISKGGDLSAASRHGLGYDGWQRAKYLAAYKGSGAEQDRYEARFGAFGQQAAQAVKDKVNEIRR